MFICDCSRSARAPPVVVSHFQALLQDAAPPRPPPPAAVPAVRPSVSRVLPPLLWFSNVYRLLSHALESCSRVMLSCQNWRCQHAHKSRRVFLLRLNTCQEANCFVHVLLCHAPWNMLRSTCFISYAPCIFVICTNFTYVQLVTTIRLTYLCICSRYPSLLSL